MKLLELSILPYVVLTHDHQLVMESKGSFFKFVDDNFTFEKNRDFYQHIQMPGWNTSPQGYAVYTIFFNNLFISFTGLKVKDISSIHGKDKGVPYYFKDKTQVEDYVKKIIAIYQDFNRDNAVLFNEYSHETKEILRDIYQKALEIKNNCNLSNYYNELLENIFAFTGLLSTKTDIIGFVNNTDLSSYIPENNICVHKKFSKLIKCFNAKAKNKNIDIITEGSSYRTISGPRGFELIPFLLLENAIKYSPQNNTITLYFEDLDDRISVKIESMGPYIDETELHNIFSKNYRGQFARMVEPSGHVIGLYTVKEFLKKGFNGIISVSQSKKNAFTLNNISYLQTVFELNIPS